MAPAEELRQNPFKNAVAILPLREAVELEQSGQAVQPEHSGRFAVTVDGTESEEDIAKLKVHPSLIGFKKYSEMAIGPLPEPVFQ